MSLLDGKCISQKCSYSLLRLRGEIKMESHNWFQMIRLVRDACSNAEFIYVMAAVLCNHHHRRLSKPNLEQPSRNLKRLFEQSGLSLEMTEIMKDRTHFSNFFILLGSFICQLNFVGKEQLRRRSEKTADAYRCKKANHLRWRYLLNFKQFVSKF